MIGEIIDEFASGSSLDQMIQNIDIEQIRYWFECGKTMRIDVERLGGFMEHEEKLSYIEKLGFLPFSPKINLKKP